MASNEELEKQLKSLRSELAQMREVVNALLSMVVEDDEEEEYLGFGDGFDLGRFNT